MSLRLSKNLSWKWLYIGAVILSIVGSIFIIPQLLYRVISFKYDIKYYLKQVKVSILLVWVAKDFMEKAVAYDNLAGSFIFGSSHTISAIVGLKAYNNSRFYMAIELMIDSMFYHGHCIDSAFSEDLIKGSHG